MNNEIVVVVMVLILAAVTAALTLCPNPKTPKPVRHSQPFTDHRYYEYNIIALQYDL